MRHPVYLAFYMNHLDPEGRRAVRRWSIRIAVVCAALTLLLLTIVAVRISMLPINQLVGVSRAIAAEPAGMTECALRDLQLVISIEAHGEAQDVPASKLANAFFTMMTAREASAAERIDEALAIYDSIALPLLKQERNNSFRWQRARTG